jgi:hypothetical protein
LYRSKSARISSSEMLPRRGGAVDVVVVGRSVVVVGSRVDVVVGS